jgi:hypothetical protein
VNWCPSVVQSTPKLHIPAKTIQVTQTQTQDLSLDDQSESVTSKSLRLKGDSDHSTNIASSDSGKSKGKDKVKGKLAEKLKKSKLPLVCGDAGIFFMKYWKLYSEDYLENLIQKEGLYVIEVRNASGVWTGCVW